MSTTFTDIIVSNTANIASGNITNLQSNNITTNELICDSITIDNLINTSNTLNLEGAIINIGNSGSQVNIIGSTTFIDTTNTNIKDNLITLNKGGLSAVNSGIEIEDTGAIISTLKLDSTKDFIITSPNNKLTVDNLSTTNITGVSSISSTSATLNTLVCNGYAQFKGDVLLGDTAVDTLTVNATTDFENSVSIAGDTTLGSLATNTTNINGLIRFDNGYGKKVIFNDTTFNDYQYFGFDVTSSYIGYNVPISTKFHSFFTGVNSTSKLESVRIGTRTNPTSKTTGSLIIAGTGGIGCGGDIYCTNLNASGTLMGSLLTAAQPNITTVGTLSYLNVSGAITGTLSTPAQTSITSVGTLTSLNVSGNLAVDTNVLKVDTVNNRVGINTTTPTNPLHVTGNTLITGNLTCSATVSCTTLDATNIALDTITSTTINNSGALSVSGVSTLSGNTIIGATGTNTLQVNATPTFSQLSLFNDGADIFPRYDSGWFSVTKATRYSINLPFTVDFTRPPTFQLFYSNTSTGIIGNGTGTTNFCLDITSQGVNSAWDFSYAIRYSSTSSVYLNTGNSQVALSFNGIVGVTHLNGYYRLYAR